MSVFRAVVTWNGFSGSPGYTNLYFVKDTAPTQIEMNNTTAKIRTWLNTFAGLLPSGVTIAYPDQLDEFDEEDGTLLATHPVDGITVTAGVASGAYSSAAGACVSWNTNTIVNGRRIRGRTFLVPLAPAVAFQTDGTLLATQRTSIINASQTFATSATGIPFAVWRRPRPGVNSGNAGLVLTASVADKTAILRSRRD